MRRMLDMTSVYLYLTYTPDVMYQGLRCAMYAGVDVMCSGCDLQYTYYIRWMGAMLHLVPYVLSRSN